VEQRDELRFHALAAFEHLSMIDGLVENPGGHIRDARNSQDADAHVARHDHFRNGRHANEIRANRPQIANLSGRFVTRPGESGINSFVNTDAELQRFGERNFAVGLPVDLGHVREARAEALIIRTDQWVRALKIDVVADDNERAPLEVVADAAGGVREDGGANARLLA
jgi:hypothetical protein